MNEPFIHPVRVYWEDTDAGGVVYHAQYLAFLERARSEWMRALGNGQELLREVHGLVFAVRAMRIDFRAPARLDDLLDVAVELRECRRASLVLAQSIGGAPADGAALSIQIDGSAEAFIKRLNALGIDDVRLRDRMTGLPEMVIRHPNDKVYDAVRDTAVELDVSLISMTGRTRSLEDLYLQAVGATMLDPEMHGETFDG